MTKQRSLIPQITDDTLHKLAKRIKLLERREGTFFELIIPVAMLRWLDFRHEYCQKISFNERIEELKRVRIYCRISSGKDGNLCVTLAEIFAQIKDDAEISHVFTIEVERKNLEWKNQDGVQFHQFTLIMYKKINT